MSVSPSGASGASRYGLTRSGIVNPSKRKARTCHQVILACPLWRPRFSRRQLLHFPSFTLQYHPTSRQVKQHSSSTLSNARRNF